MLNKKEFSLPLKVSFISRGLLSSPEMVKTEKQGTHTLWQKLRRKQMRIRERPEAGGAGQRSGKSSQDSRIEMSSAVCGGASHSTFPAWAKPSCWKEVDESRELRKSRDLSIRKVV